MRKFLALFAVFHLVLIGCNGLEKPTEVPGNGVKSENPLSNADATTQPLTSFSVGDYIVNILSYEEDEVSRHVEIFLLVDDGVNISHYSIVAQSPEEYGDTVQYCSSLLDNSGEMQVEVSIEVPVTSDKEWVVITERTPQDILQIHGSVEKGVITESYNLNGEIRSFRYLMPAHAVDRVCPHLSELPDVSGTILTRPGAAVELGHWDVLLDPGNTLNSNPSGELFSLVMTAPEFLDWVQQEFSTGEANTADISDRAKLCAIAAIISLKCLIPGTAWANFLCISSFSIALTCAVTTILSWIFD